MLKASLAGTAGTVKRSYVVGALAVIACTDPVGMVCGCPPERVPSGRIAGTIAYADSSPAAGLVVRTGSLINDSLVWVNWRRDSTGAAGEYDVTVYGVIGSLFYLGVELESGVVTSVTPSPIQVPLAEYNPPVTRFDGVVPAGGRRP